MGDKLDLLIKGGMVADGEGGPLQQKDVAVFDDLIVDVKSGLFADAKHTIDASGCVVCPGFIDMHSHSDFTLLVDGRGLSKIHQGVTLEVVGNCGASPGPIIDEGREGFMEYMNTLGMLYKRTLKPEDWKWKTLAGFWNLAAASGLGLNIAPLVGQSTLRSLVMGYESRPASEAEMEKMKALLKKEMSMGAFGLSSGLIYHPGAFAQKEELADLASVLKPFKGIYATHMRSEGNNLLDAVQETIYVAEKAGVSVEISHLKSELPANWGNSKKALALIDEARKKGLSVDFDQYPYRAYHSGLLEIFPTWAKEKGTAHMMAVLQNEGQKQKVVKEMTRGPFDWENPMEGLAWADIRLVGFYKEPYRDLEGRTVEEISRRLDMDPLEAVFRVFLEEKGGLGMIVFSMCEEEVEEIMQKPYGMVGSDGSSVAPDGPTGAKKVHPRFYGTFPRILGRYVREKKVLPLETAIHKMTRLPALKLGLFDRGLVKTGCAADLVVFDPDTVVDRADFEESRRFPEGILHVVVNGRPVVSDSRFTGELPGRILSKS